MNNESKKITNFELQTSKILSIKTHLEDLLNVSPTEYVSFIKSQIQILENALKRTKDTPIYKIAVAGRFKVGKSAFVNTLMNVRLAGVNVNPETATITTFRYAKTPLAEIKFISLTKWQQLYEDWINGIKNPEIARVENFYNFSNDNPNITPDNLVKKHIGKERKFSGSNWQDKQPKKDFEEEIQKYTSAEQQIHYLVDRIIVHAPIDILQGIELIDTPGLDDPDRYRVYITEELLQDVDDILFLTSSGSSYSQTDKDFIIHQLRFNRIKNIQLILTKIDETFANALRDAKDKEEPEPNFNEFCEKEKKRVEREIKKTLNELLNDNGIDDNDRLYFDNQLSNIPIHIISVNYKKDKNPILKDGGINEIAQTIKKQVDDFIIKKTQQNQEILDSSLESVNHELDRYFTERNLFVTKQFNSDEAINELGVVEENVQKKLNTFKEILDIHFKELDDRIFNTFTLQNQNEFIQTIYAEIKKILDEFQQEDIQIHWKIKRSLKWGMTFFQDVQKKIANRTFPKISIFVNKLSNHFDNHVEKTTSILIKLKFEPIYQETRSILKYELTKQFINSFKKESQSLLEKEQIKITRSLHDFITDDLKKELESTREKVSKICGNGTGKYQNEEIEKFYRKTEIELRKSLIAHLSRMMKAFIDFIKEKAKSIVPELEDVLKKDMEKTKDAIESSVKTINDSERLDDSIKFINDVLRIIQLTK